MFSADFFYIQRSHKQSFRGSEVALDQEKHLQLIYAIVEVFNFEVRLAIV